MTKLTKTQRFILKCLHAPGHVPEPKGRYTLSLRILEERGLVGHSMSHGWYIKQAGRAVLEIVVMSNATPETESDIGDYNAEESLSRLSSDKVLLLAERHDLRSEIDRLRAALTWIRRHIESNENPNIDKIHTVARHMKLANTKKEAE